MTISQIVVVGAGLAGSRSVMELRARGYGGKITLLGAEHLPPYDRPPLSEELLSRTDPKWLRDEVGADLESADVEVALGEPVQGMALNGNTWVLATHRRELHADAVIAATGSQSLVPSAWKDAASLHTWDDATRLRENLTDADSLVCIGAGWIGAEVSTVAAAAGKEVTVLEASSAPLFSVLGEEVGQLLVPWYEEAGITLRTNSTVATANAAAVTLTGGEVIAGDAVLAAVGVRPQTQWLETTEVDLSVSNHIWVDAAQRASLPGLWAVGDCSIRSSTVHGTVVGGHWDAALNDPARAAASILSQEIPSEPAPYVFSNQLGRNIALVGSPQHSSRWALRGNTAETWSALWFNDADQLVAVFTADRPRDSIDARRMLAGGPVAIDRQIALDPAQRLRAALL